MGWTQYTAKEWADEAGHTSGSHSGLSELERGRTIHPRAAVFFALAAMNKRIANRDFQGVHTRDLRDQLEKSRPILTPSGEPWGPADFWSCRNALLSAPDWLAEPVRNQAPAISMKQAHVLSHQWAEAVRTAGRASGNPSDFDRAVKAAPAKYQDQWKSVLCGFYEYKPEDLQQLWDIEASNWMPALWVTALTK